jgi:hypothetical protein
MDAWQRIGTLRPLHIYILRQRRDAVSDIRTRSCSLPRNRLCISTRKPPSASILITSCRSVYYTEILNSTRAIYILLNKKEPKENIIFSSFVLAKKFYTLQRQFSQHLACFTRFYFLFLRWVFILKVSLKSCSLCFCLH